MDFTILASAADNTAAGTAEEAFAPIDMFWSQITSLSWLEALTFISFGIHLQFAALCMNHEWLFETAREKN